MRLNWIAQNPSTHLVPEKKTYHDHNSSVYVGPEVADLAGRHNTREAGTMKQMQSVFALTVGRKITFNDLVF